MMKSRVVLEFEVLKWKGDISEFLLTIECQRNKQLSQLAEETLVPFQPMDQPFHPEKMVTSDQF